MIQRPGRPSKLLPRPVYFTVLGMLFLFWTTLIVSVAVVFGMSAWDSRDGDGVSAVAPSATPVASPAPTATATPEPRPSDVPLTAVPIDGPFDTGEVQRHLFFHIACGDGVLVIVTTDEHVYAESSCAVIPQAQVVPFLGRPVRITIGEGRLDLVSDEGARLQFDVRRAWLERR